jgi:hypothetical protein
MHLVGPTGSGNNIWNGLLLLNKHEVRVSGSVADPNPDPDPPDPHVFGPPGSGSTGQRYGSGSGSFYHHAKIVRKTLIPTIFLTLFDFLSLKNDVNVDSKSNKQKKIVLKNYFFASILKVDDENSRIRI